MQWTEEPGGLQSMELQKSGTWFSDQTTTKRWNTEHESIKIKSNKKQKEQREILQKSNRPFFSCSLHLTLNFLVVHEEGQILFRWSRDQNFKTIYIIVNIHVSHDSSGKESAC